MSCLSMLKVHGTIEYQGEVGMVITSLGLDKSGYRLITNDGKNANQEVPHFHIHLVGGENLGGIKGK